MRLSATGAAARRAGVLSAETYPSEGLLRRMKRGLRWALITAALVPAISLQAAPWDHLVP